jgi:anti-sigma regulatory factor (Ser/Thr protein kinase)
MRRFVALGMGRNPLVSEVRLRVPIVVDAPEDARRWLSEMLSTVAPELSTDVLLIVSEAVTNALIPHRGESVPDEEIEVDLSLEPGVIRGEIRDGRLGFDVELSAFDDHVAGRLYLIDRLASRWGLEFTDGARLWFEVRADSESPDA